MKDWRIVAILLLCVVLAGSVACDLGDTGEVSQQLVEVVRGDLTVIISGSGNIDVSRDVKLSFGSGGKINKMYVDEGDKVIEGDVLAKLNTGALELALAQAKVARDEAEYNLNQLKDVLHASYDRVKIAEAQLEAAEQAVAEAQRQLDEAVITAPFDGVVANVDAKEGDVIPSPTMAPKAIIHLVDLTTMELNAEVDEVDIAEVKPGQRAIIEIDALPTLQLEGNVISISLLPQVEAGVVVYKVKIGFDVPPDYELKVGMSADADIVINERNNVLLVPDRAITKDSQGNPMVKVMVNEEIEERPVVIGISDGYQTEIVDGLKEGETVVVERRGG